MKIIISFLAAILLLTGSLFAQANFTAKPGAIINCADFGMRMDKINPYFGLDVAWLTVSYSEDDVSDYESSYYENYYRHKSKDSYDLDGSALLFVPHFGVKYYFNDDFSSGNVVPYLKGCFFFTIPSVSAEWTEINQDWYYDESGLTNYYYEEDKEKLEGKEKDLVNDILSFWGLELAFGGEYFFSDKFSLGGEFGMRMLFNSAEYSEEDEWSSGEPGDPYYEHDSDAWENEVSATFKLTFASVSLNYYF